MDSKKNVYVTGASTATVTGLDYATIKYTQRQDILTKLEDANPPSISTGAKPLLEQLENYALGMKQNYPNPFNMTTSIRYALAEAGEVRLVVYNVAGQLVRVLVNSTQTSGLYEIQWDGRDALGRGVATGMYIYRLEAGGKLAVGRMVLTK